MFEQLYGQDENALSELMDDDKLGPNERILATELLIGAKEFKKLSKDDRAVLDTMAHHLAASTPSQASSKSEPKVVRDKEPDVDFYNQ